jgi:hypothetical protein
MWEQSFAWRFLVVWYTIENNAGVVGPTVVHFAPWQRGSARSAGSARSKHRYVFPDGSGNQLRP